MSFKLNPSGLGSRGGPQEVDLELERLFHTLCQCHIFSIWPKVYGHTRLCLTFCVFLLCGCFFPLKVLSHRTLLKQNELLCVRFVEADVCGLKVSFWFQPRGVFIVHM